MKVIKYNDKKCLYFEGQQVSSDTYDRLGLRHNLVDSYITNNKHNIRCNYMKWDIIVKQCIFESAVEKELGLIGIETDEYLFYAGANLKYDNNNRIEIEYGEVSFENITKIFKRKLKIKNILNR